MTTATAPFSSKTGRSSLQDSLFSWLEPETTADAETPEPEQKAAPPRGRPLREKPGDLSHTWVVAAEIEVTPEIAKVADYRGSYKATDGQRVDALEVCCKGCRRPPGAPRWAHAVRTGACISGLTGCAFALCVPVGWIGITCGDAHRAVTRRPRAR